MRAVHEEMGAATGDDGIMCFTPGCPPYPGLKDFTDRATKDNIIVIREGRKLACVAHVTDEGSIKGLWGTADDYVEAADALVEYDLEHFGRSFADWPASMLKAHWGDNPDNWSGQTDLSDVDDDRMVRVEVVNGELRTVLL